MSFLGRVDEELINQKSNLLGHDEVFNNCKKIIDLVHGQEKSLNALFEELDIRSINIFHGETGTGKTTLSYALAKYALEKYEVETYELKAQEIIATELGKTLENFHKAYKEIYDLCSVGEGIILFLDEFDRFLVNREKDDEISELKRALISLMDFFQSISVKHKITILATTNCFDALDPAFRRRFSFQYEILCNREMLEQYAEGLARKIPASLRYHLPKQHIENSNTIADFKRLVREDLVKLLGRGDE